MFDEQDKGFWFGLNELRKQAKRPIIITSNGKEVELSQMIQYHKWI